MRFAVNKRGSVRAFNRSRGRTKAVNVRGVARGGFRL